MSNFERPSHTDLSVEQLNSPENRKKRLQRIVFLVEKIAELGEKIPFPGIDPEYYENMKKEERTLPEGYFTPIDELIKKYKTEGMKVVSGNDPFNIFALPYTSAKLVEDSILIDRLDFNNVGNSLLRELIQLRVKK